MKIVVIAQHFFPDTSQRVTALVKQWMAEGNEVTVVCAFPSWPREEVDPPYRKKFLVTERLFGAHVIRTYFKPYRGRSAVRRIISYLSFAFSSFLSLRYLSTGQIDLIYVYLPPPTVGLFSWLLKIVHRSPVVMDIQDLWPEAGLAAGLLKHSLLRNLVGGGARIAYGAASHLLTICDEFHPHIRHYAPRKTPISTIYNWTDEAVYFPAAKGKSANREAGKFLVMYSGNMGLTHGIDKVFEAMVEVQSRLDCRFVFSGAGPGYTRLMELARAHPEMDFNLLGYVEDQHQMKFLYADADLMLVHLSEDSQSAFSIPSRIAAYLACGRPVLIAAAGATRRLYEPLGGVVACDPNSAHAIASSIVRLARNASMREALAVSARLTYERFLSFSIGYQRVTEVMERLVSRDRVIV